MRSVVRYVLLLLSVAALASCGSGSASSEEVATGETWWVFDSTEFTLVDGGLERADIAEAVRTRWLLEYSNGPNVLQLQASEEGSRYQTLMEGFADIGSVELDGVEATLRQAPPGSGNGDPSVALAWSEGGLFFSFGGPSVSEDRARELAGQLRRVPQSEWEAVVDTIPRPPTPSTATTRLG